VLETLHWFHLSVNEYEKQTTAKIVAIEGDYKEKGCNTKSSENRTNSDDHETCFDDDNGYKAEAALKKAKASSKSTTISKKSNKKKQTTLSSIVTGDDGEDDSDDPDEELILSPKSREVVISSTISDLASLQTGSLKVADLKVLCRREELTVGGKKVDLMNRCETHLTLKLKRLRGADAKLNDDVALLDGDDVSSDWDFDIDNHYKKFLDGRNIDDPSHAETKVMTTPKRREKKVPMGRLSDIDGKYGDKSEDDGNYTVDDDLDDPSGKFWLPSPALSQKSIKKRNKTKSSNNRAAEEDGDEESTKAIGLTSQRDRDCIVRQAAAAAAAAATTTANAARDEVPYFGGRGHISVDDSKDVSDDDDEEDSQDGSGCCDTELGRANSHDYDDEEDNKKRAPRKLFSNELNSPATAEHKVPNKELAVQDDGDQQRKGGKQSGNKNFRLVLGGRADYASSDDDDVDEDGSMDDFIAEEDDEESAGSAESSKSSDKEDNKVSDKENVGPKNDEEEEGMGSTADEGGDIESEENIEAELDEEDGDIADADDTRAAGNSSICSLHSLMSLKDTDDEDDEEEEEGEDE